MAIFKTIIQILTSLFGRPKNTEKTEPKKEEKISIKTEEKSMYKYGTKSKERLATCHPDIQKVFNEVIKHTDCSIIEGVRSKERQEELVRTGKSKTLKSKHLEHPDGYSYAVDCIAYPIEWDNYQRNYMFAGFVKGIAASMGITLRLGADWDGDFTTKDQTFHDLPHFELKK